MRGIEDPKLFAKRISKYISRTALAAPRLDCALPTTIEGENLFGEPRSERAGEERREEIQKLNGNGGKRNAEG